MKTKATGDARLEIVAQPETIFCNAEGPLATYVLVVAFVVRCTPETLENLKPTKLKFGLKVEPSGARNKYAKYNYEENLDLRTKISTIEVSRENLSGSVSFRIEGICSKHVDQHLFKLTLEPQGDMIAGTESRPFTVLTKRRLLRAADRNVERARRYEVHRIIEHFLHIFTPKLTSTDCLEAYNTPFLEFCGISKDEYPDQGYPSLTQGSKFLETLPDPSWLVETASHVSPSNGKTSAKVVSKKSQEAKTPKSKRSLAKAKKSANKVALATASAKKSQKRRFREVERGDEEKENYTNSCPPSQRRRLTSKSVKKVQSSIPQKDSFIYAEHQETPKKSKPVRSSHPQTPLITPSPTPRRRAPPPLLKTPSPVRRTFVIHNSQVKSKRELWSSLRNDATFEEFVHESFLENEHPQPLNQDDLDIADGFDGLLNEDPRAPEQKKAQSSFGYSWPLGDDYDTDSKATGTSDALDFDDSSSGIHKHSSNEAGDFMDILNNLDALSDAEEEEGFEKQTNFSKQMDALSCASNDSSHQFVASISENQTKQSLCRLNSLASQQCAFVNSAADFNVHVPYDPLAVDTEPIGLIDHDTQDFMAELAV